ncbi:MAG TPA: hypothetical protein VF765_00750 [Polyangiaceae bacterium]
MALTALGIAACKVGPDFSNLTFNFGPNAGPSAPPCDPTKSCCDCCAAPAVGTDAGLIPQRPGGPAAPASNGPTVFAVSRFYFGDTDRSGKASTDAWAKLGLNIDGKTTSELSNDTCKLVTGAPCATQLDGDNGIDNSFGANLMPIIGVFNATYSAYANRAIQKGGPTLLIELDGLGPDADYAPQAGALYRATAVQNPMWDGRDVRNFDPASLVTGDISRPAAVFFNGFMRDRTWVGVPPAAGAAYLDLQITAGGHLLPPVPLQHVEIVMPVAPDGRTVTNGVLSGVIRTSDAVAWTTLWANGIDTWSCGGGAVESLTAQIAQASDIMSDGSGGVGHTCDGISVGLGFDAVAVRLGQAESTQPFSDPCADGGLDATDVDTGD